MGIGDKFKKILNIEEGYFDEAYGEDVEYEASSEGIKRAPVSSASAGRMPSATTSHGKVVDIHTTAKLQVVLKKPQSFEEATGIADELLDKRTVVLNLEATAKDEAGRLLCFLSGVAYANGGKLKKIANNTYIITPYNVDVMGDLLDELENNGMFFV